uniref:Uncharacterized protein n=1 Tax=Lepeophtheirus salmonis TaxID=72036 RepID=A0A0K2TFX7_LEPSM
MYIFSAKCSRTIICNIMNSEKYFLKTNKSTRRSLVFYKYLYTFSHSSRNMHFKP